MQDLEFEQDLQIVNTAPMRSCSDITYHDSTSTLFLSTVSLQSLCSCTNTKRIITQSGIEREVNLKDPG